MQVYALTTCDTCRKALAALRAAGHEPEVTDIRRDGVPEKALAAMLAALGPDRLVNRRSTTWRALPEAEREGPAARVLADHPTLMKRPVIHHQGRWHAGWDADVRATLLG
ncbi:ArsC/Spx/MgsR family protein [Histidinibacterium lentulum]|uniref:Arsenate reductase n=1 Tax=Histidinibacterium lentulum TaxID=2480588 RepID=A0A3N2QTM8_9RHOB|nr:ArsC/Spx/MgsR family protein [Histidinibacterium lentulum]ROT98558.1 arsenate reductase [Histidinibacterium lentulum]